MGSRLVSVGLGFRVLDTGFRASGSGLRVHRRAYDDGTTTSTASAEQHKFPPLLLLSLR